jgi:hypothetical protein
LCVNVHDVETNISGVKEKGPFLNRARKVKIHYVYCCAPNVGAPDTMLLSKNIPEGCDFKKPDLKIGFQKHFG